jgi:Histidine kinase-, DNA gyrase B-, and HSP90-like ATPase
VKVKLDVQPDHLEEVAQTRPIVGVAELIWNAVDADAKAVTVAYKKTFTDGIDGITVTDNGHDIEHDDAVTSFGKLGGSWKKAKCVSPEGRALHGQEGKGRFKAFYLGNTITWNTVYESNGVLKAFRVRGKRPALDEFDVAEPKETNKSRTGTIVEVSHVRDCVASLDDPQKVADELARRMAIYLRAYPSVRIEVEGIQVDPSRAESHSASYRLPDIALSDGRAFSAKLDIIEWSVQIERALYLCDASGFARLERSPGIQAPGWNFTAYLASDLVADLKKRGAFAVGAIHPDNVKLMDAAKRQMREHFTRRAEGPDRAHGAAGFRRGRAPASRRAARL